MFGNEFDFVKVFGLLAIYPIGEIIYHQQGNSFDAALGTQKGLLVEVRNAPVSLSNNRFD